MQEDYVLVLQEREGDAPGEVSVVSGVDEAGRVETVPADEAHSGSRLIFSRHDGPLETFFRNLISQYYNPLRTGLWRVATRNVEGLVSRLQAGLRAAEAAEAAEGQAQPVDADAEGPRPGDAAEAEGEARTDAADPGSAGDAAAEGMEGVEAVPLADGYSLAEAQPLRRTGGLLDVSGLDLAALGLDRDELERRGDLAALARGERTGLLDVRLPVGEGFVAAQAQLEARAGADGAPELVARYRRFSLDLESPFMGYSFSEEERARLAETGHLGRVVELEDGHGGVFPAYVSVNRATNEVAALRADGLPVEAAARGLDLGLGPEQLAALRAGGAVPLDSLPDGHPLRGERLVVDAASKGLRLAEPSGADLPPVPLRMDPRLFGAEALDWDSLAQLGIDRASLAASGDLDRLLAGGCTGLVEVQREVDGQPVALRARLELRRGADGGPVVDLQYVQPAQSLARELASLGLPAADMARLEAAGHLDRAVELPSPSGGTLRAYVAVDRETNSVRVVDASRVEVPRVIDGHALSADAHAALVAGGPVEVGGRVAQVVAGQGLALYERDEDGRLSLRESLPLPLRGVSPPGVVESLRRPAVEPADPARVDWKQLESLGLSRAALESAGELDRLLHWGKTDLLPVQVQAGGQSLATEARLRLRRGADGAPELVVHYKRLAPDLERPFMGHSFSGEERARLADTGHLGGRVELVDAGGERFPAYVSVDAQTRELVALRADRVEVPRVVHGYRLSEAQHAELAAGRAVRMEGITLPDGSPFRGTVRVDAAARGLLFRRDGARRDRDQVAGLRTEPRATEAQATRRRKGPRM